MISKVLISCTHFKITWNVSISLSMRRSYTIVVHVEGDDVMTNECYRPTVHQTILVVVSDPSIHPPSQLVSQSSTRSLLTVLSTI